MYQVCTVRINHQNMNRRQKTKPDETIAITMNNTQHRHDAQQTRHPTASTIDKHRCRVVTASSSSPSQSAFQSSASATWSVSIAYPLLIAYSTFCLITS